VCDREFDPSNQSLIKWKAFEKVSTRKIKEGEPKEVVCLKPKLTSSLEFILYVVPKI